MELTINRRELARALEPVTKIADRKTTQAVLEHLRLVAASGVASMSSTNHYQSARSSAVATIKKGGDILVPAAAFGAAVARMPEGDVVIATAKGSLELRAGRACVRLPTMSSDDFPASPLTDEGTWISLPGDAVRSALAAGWAAGTDSSRAHLCALLFELDERGLRGAAINGYVLAVHDISLDRPRTPLRCVIPSQAIPLIQRVIATADVVDVLLGRCFEVRVGATHFATVPGDAASFAPFEQIIPKDVATKARVVRATLLEAIDRASLALDSKSPALEVKIAAGVLSVRSDSPDRGTAGDELDVDQEGADVTFYVAPLWLRDSVKNHISDEVTINIADPLKPIVILGEGGRLTLACPMDLKR